MINCISYWAYDRDFRVSYEYSDTQNITDNEVKFISYIYSSIKKLLKSRGFELDNCSIIIGMQDLINFRYTQKDGDSFAIYLFRDELTEVEQEVVDKIKELKEQENEN